MVDCVLARLHDLAMFRLVPASAMAGARKRLTRSPAEVPLTGEDPEVITVVPAEARRPAGGRVTLESTHSSAAVQPASSPSRRSHSSLWEEEHDLISSVSERYSLSWRRRTFLNIVTSHRSAS